VKPPGVWRETRRPNTIDTWSGRPSVSWSGRLRELIAGLIPGYTARQMTYDLRRLRRKHFIQRIPAPSDTS